MGKRYRVILFMLLVIGGIFSFGQTVQAEDAIEWPIAIDETNFPDEEFRNYLLEKYFGIDDGILSKEEMENITIIDVRNTNVTSLEGIKYFQNLQRLYCIDTEIDTLDVSQNINLEYLDCPTGIRILDVSQNSNLVQLSCSNTGISILDVSNCKNLEILSCSNTGVSILDVSNCKNLEILYCSNTGIRILDVSQNSNLVQLSCFNTGISILDVSNNPKLESLDCNNTKISILDVSKSTNLKILNCANTGISILDVSNLLNLVQLDCSNTEIRILDVSNHTNLEALYCYNTGISILDVCNHTNLRALYCYNTKISILDVSKNMYLESLNCGGTGISILDVSKNLNLVQLWCNNTGISILDVSKNTNLKSLNCSGTEIRILDVKNNTKLVELSCYYTKIYELDVSNLINLEQLSCNNTEISNIDVSNTSLTWLNCTGCKTPILITSEKIVDLVDLYCYGTGINELDVSKNTNLVDLNCHHTGISELDISKNTNLVNLYCYDTVISSLDVSNTSLTKLSCYNCVTPVMLSSGNIIDLSQLTGFNVSKMSNLQNATLSEGKLRVEDPSEIVSYTYDCGKSMSITFKLEILSYEIKYDANDGTGQMAQATAKKGELYTLPKNEFTAPSGKQFKEWSIGRTSGDKIKAGETYTFSEAVTVYAVWENKPIAIDETNFPDEEFINYLLGQTFGANDGKISEEEMKNVIAIDVSGNKNITSLKGIEYFQNLQQLDCSNTGISSLDVSNTSLTDLSCDGCITPVLLSSGNIIDLSQLTGFDISKMSNLQNATLSEGKLTVGDPSKMVSYTYDCGKSMSADFNLEISSFDIKYDANGGTGQMAGASATKGKLFILPKNEFTAPSGKQFKEWSIGSTSGDKIKAGETYTFSEAVTVYAVWENKPITIDETNFPDDEFRNYLLGQDFGADDGKISEVEMKNVIAIDVSGNKNITSLKGIEYFQNLQQLDCSFTGISSLDVSNTSLTDLSCDGCITPVLLSSGNIIDLSQLTGFDISKMSNLQNATLSEGKLRVEDPSEIVSYTYDCGKSMSADFNLEILSYKIKYDANGGTGQMAGASATKGESITLPENGFTAPSGMQFKEWSIGSTSGDKVKAGETYTFTRATTVYAVWETTPVSVTTYAITFNANGGTGQMAKATATKGTAFTLPQNSFTAPSGKRFKEWAVGSTGGTKVKAGSAYTFTGATTVYAVWETIPSTVKDVKKATFKELQLKAKASKKSNKLSWKRVKGADGYIVYGAKRGKKLTEIKASTKGVSFTHKKLSRKTFYQYQVKAYRLINGEKKIISVSQNIYSVTTGGKYDNAKKMTVNMSKLTLKKGRTKAIKAKLVATNGKKMKNYTKAFRYETSNSKVAAVSAKGKIKARKKGKCTIYVYAQNGLSKSIRVTVK